MNIRLIDHSSSIVTAPPMNAYGALSLPTYKRAVSLISECLASFPKSVRLNGEKQDGHRLQPLLRRRPNGYQSALPLWTAWFLHAVHRGNGYLRVERDRTGRAIALHTMDPSDVLPFRLEQDGQTSQFYHDASRKIVYPAADVLHLMSFSYDGLAGIDPVTLHGEVLKRAALVDRYQTRFLESGSFLRGYLSVKDTMTPEEMEQTRAEMRRRHSGIEADQDLAILTNGGEIKNLSLSPVEGQVMEQARNVNRQIAQIFGLDAQFVGEIGEQKYNGSIESQGQNIVRYCLRFWVEKAEDELTAKLLSASEQDAGYAVKLNPDALLRGDTAAVVDSVVKTITSGLRTPNEGRSLIGEPPSDDPEANKLKRTGDTSPTK